MAYDLTNLSNVTGFDDLLLQMNNLSGQFLFIALTVAIYIIIFVNTLRWGTKQAFGTASFLTALIVSLFYALGFVPFIMLFLFWVLAGVGALVLYGDRDSVQ